MDLRQKTCTLPIFLVLALMANPRTLVHGQKPPNNYLLMGTTIESTGSTSYSGEQAVRIGEILKVNFTISLNGSHPAGARLLAHITLPHDEVKSRSGCKNLLNSWKCDSRTTINTSRLDLMLVEKSLIVTTTPSVLVQKTDMTKNSYQIKYDFGIVSLNSTITDPNPEIEIYFESSFTEDAEESETNPFNVTGMATTQPGVELSTFISDTEVYFIRPIIDMIAASASQSELSSGVTSTATVRIGHLPSSATATNVSFSIYFGLNGVAKYNNDATVKINGGAASSISDLQDAASLSSFSTSSYIDFSWSFTAVNLPLLGKSAEAHITVTYERASVSGNPLSTKSFWFVQNAPSLLFSTDPNDVNLPAVIAADTTYEIRNTISVPKGKINSFIFGCEFSSTEFVPIPISLTSSTVTGASLVFDSPEKKSATTNDFDITASRKKRSPVRVKRATTSLQAKHTVGGITNQGPSASKLSILVKMATLSPSTGGMLQTANTYLLINGVKYYLTSSATQLSKPVLSASKTAKILDASEQPAIMRFSMSVDHDNVSYGDAYDVTLKGGNEYFDVFWRDGLTGPDLKDLTVSDKRKYNWLYGILKGGASLSISYKAKSSNIPDGDTWLNATVSYKSTPTGSVYYETVAGCCVSRNNIYESNVFTNHGFTVLALIFGIILGLLIVILVFFIIVKVCKKVPFASKEYDSVQTKSHELAVGGGLVTDSKMAKQGVFNSKDVEKSMGSSMTESIVYIIAKPDKMKVFRELDDRDIQSTIYTDTKLEEERDEAMKSATINLIMGLKANGDLSSDTVDKCVKNFKKKVATLDKKSEEGFRFDLEDAYRKRSAKNRETLADLLSRQQEEEEDLQERTANMDPKERDEVYKLTKKKHETEKNELTYGLKLEQEEETEKIRKEYAIRRRMGLKELQQETLDDVKKEGKLTEQQADWMMKEYLQNQAGVDRIFDEEVARQRMILEEKLARRRELAQRAEIQEDHQAELLNKMAEQVDHTINKLKKEGALSPEEAKVLIEKAHDEMMESKEKMDMERARQETELQQRLSERKRKRMEEEMKKQENERADLQKKHKQMQTEGYVGPLALLEEEQKLLSTQRQELSQKENDIDKDHAEELLKLRDDLVEDAKKTINMSKEKLFVKMGDDGLTEDQANKIISKHRKEMDKLEESHSEEREKQRKHFEKALKRRRMKYNVQREEEQKHQEQVREQEDQVVRNIMDNQLAMSESERDRILKEHEKQMVKLENSLTLKKLQQKKMLEERLAKKRAEQMEKLQRKQQQETKKVARQMDIDSDMDEEERHQHELNMMKKHAEQSIAILQGEKIDIEDELEVIKSEMLKEREAALEEQEVKLGAMLAQLQMEKAKEMSRIEEQQKAILNLKSNLMDDLTEKGILSSPECQKVIDIHNKEQEKLKKTLDEQRAKQEKALRRRLQDRLAQKEANLANLQEKQMKDISQGGNTPAARIRRVALKQKHLLEMEQFRNRMEKEITQTLEEDRRQYDMRRLKDMQDQELQFINGLVRLGKFKMEELENVTTMLFPLKTESERKDLMDKLTEGYKARSDSPDNNDEVDGRRQEDGTLLERVKSARFERAKSASLRSARGKNQRGKLLSGNKKKKRFQPKVDKEKEKLLLHRPDPLGRSNSPDYDSDEDRYRRAAPSRLPPLGKNKKSKFEKGY